MAKIDWHILPCLCVLYLLAFLDRYDSPRPEFCDTSADIGHWMYRVNISNAATLGLTEDLNIATGMKYNIALTIFFVPYIIFEIPSNILLKKFKPHVWCMSLGLTTG